MIFCLSASYKKTKLPMLESLVFKEEDDVMKDLCSKGLTKECALVQTCNRVEIYGVLNDSQEADSVRRILKFWSNDTGISLDILTRNVDLLKGREALINLFNVASGLDSMAIGEDQILGQVKTAYAKAKKLETLGQMLGTVFARAIYVGKKVRSETRINHGSVSISSAAVDLAAKELGDLKCRTALVVGAGEAGSVVADTLKRRGAKSIIIANRTYAVGVQLAKKVLGRAITFEEIYEVMPRIDLAIVALAVDSPVVKTRKLREVYSRRRVRQGLLVVDISQPRAVEDSVSSIDGVVLKNIDNLKEIIEESIKNRQAEAAKAKRIVFEELERFERQQSELLVKPLISKIFKRVERVRQKELKRALGKMALQDEENARIMDRFSRELVERVMQIPIDQVRRAALNSDNGLLSSVEKLFKIK